MHPGLPRLASVATIALVAYSSGARAQDAATLAAQRQVDDAFRQVLTAPANMDYGIRYARAKVDAGDFEGAIAAMERLLLLPNPAPTIRVELAFLYYRLGSYAAAESYARMALADPKLDPAVRQQTETLLADVAKRGQRSQLSGFVSFGLRGQTNPLARTDEAQLRALGLAVPRTGDQKIKSDVSAELVGRIDHAYDLETQNRATVVSALTTVLQHYSSVDSYRLQRTPTKPRDLALLDANSGIRFQPAPSGAPDLTIRPNVIAGTVLLNGHAYSSNYGFGLDTSYRLNEQTLLEALYEFRHYEYATRIDVFESQQQEGNENTLRLRATRELAAGQFLIGELIGRDHDAKRAYFAYKSGEARATYAINYRNPFGYDDLLWTTSLAAGVLGRDYRGPDPLIDPRRDRSDTEYRVALTHTVPLAANWSVVLQTEYVKNDSTLPNYRYDNLAVSAAALWRF